MVHYESQSQYSCYNTCTVLPEILVNKVSSFDILFDNSNNYINISDGFILIPNPPNPKLKYPNLELAAEC